MLESRSPATGEPLGAVEPASAKAVRELAGRAAEVQPLWAAVPAPARARYVRRAARILLDDLDDLADEGPKALADRRLGRPALLRGGRRAVGVQEPRGVIGVLGGAASPWTEPALEVGAALLAGNGVVLVPAAPLAGQRLRTAFLRAGIPEDLLAVAAGDEAAGALEEACARVVSVAAPPAKSAMLVLDGAPVE